MEDPHPPPRGKLAQQPSLASPSVTEERGLMVTQAGQDLDSDLSEDSMAKTVKPDTTK